jgi:ATP-dependent Lon protease
MPNIDEQENFEIPSELPMLAIRDLVVYPFMIVPLLVSREISIQAIEDALSKDRLVFLAAQKDLTEENPDPDGIYTVGTVGMIMRMGKLPDGRIKILVQGLVKARILEYVKQKPLFAVKVDRIHESAQEGGVEAEALMRSVKEGLERFISLGKILSPDIMMVLGTITDPGRLADLVASNLGLRVQDAQEILEMTDAMGRLHRVNDQLGKEVEVLTMQAKIQQQAKEEMSRTQREYYLRQQLAAIRAELGDTDSKQEEIEELRDRVSRANISSEALEEAEKQLRRLEGMSADSAEASVVRTYLEWIVELPWSVWTEDSLDLARAKTILDDDHYDLEKIKERILEYLGVRKLKRDMKGPILCFLGPPGVGKTSLGKSIARALGRKFVRISLGGVRDEAEIRGHRRTYVGAMPGRIIQGMKQAGSNNPVFLLDEIDKLGADFRGDPTSALLEVLDPEQNNTFRDHYLNLPFDLSKVLFIGTANQVEPIPPALRDRMEVISLAGYSLEEKLVIAERHIVPKQLGENGLESRAVDFARSAIRRIVAEYTREAGLRNLERQVAAVCRKVARRFAEGFDGRVVVTAASIPKFLGPPRHLPDEDLPEEEPGIVTGLAWTQYGGEILQVEATLMTGRGALTLTGSLGDVMKESAQAALSYVRSRGHDLALDAEFFQKREIHIHVPAGAIPKDGPSAGVTITTALYSLLSGRPVRHDVAMTGEITLRGRVLPVGGIKEKVLAAVRTGIKTIVLPRQNEKDLVEIPPHIRRKIRFVPVAHVDEALRVALRPPSARVATAEAPAPKTAVPRASRAAKPSKIAAKPARAPDDARRKPAARARRSGPGA